MLIWFNEVVVVGIVFISMDFLFDKFFEFFDLMFKVKE